MLVLSLSLGICYSWGHLHVVTFSGQNYSLQSDCPANILAIDCSNQKKPTFSVQYVTKRCHSSQAETCAKEVQIFLANQKSEYILDGYVVTIIAKRKRKVVSPDYSKGGVNITFDGLFITFQTDDLTVRYDGRSRINVEVGQQFRRMASGLCTIDGVGDFRVCNRTSRSATGDTQRARLRTKAVGLSVCSTRALQESSCSRGNESEDDDYCSPLLYDDRFVPCHDVIHPLEFYQRCRRLVCKCSQQMTKSDCSCGAYASYVALCSQLGIELVWNEREACCMLTGCDGYSSISNARFSHFLLL